MLALERLVARAGSAQIEAPPSSAEPLALAAIGRLTTGGRTYSVWRIRSGADSARRVLLRSADGATSGSLTVAPHSDLFVRSEDVRSAHLLFADGVELHRLSPLPSAWHDARFVSDPLCSEPGTTLWVQHATGLLRVSPIDGQILFEIPTHTPAAIFALDPVDGSVWIWDFPQLVHVGLSGLYHAETLGLHPHAFAEIGADSARWAAVPRAAVDDAHRLWITLGHQLLMASAMNPLTAVATLDHSTVQMVFDSRARLLWLAGENRISAWPVGQAESAAAPVASWSSSALRLIAADAHNGGIWVLAGAHLSNYDAFGQLRADQSLRGAPRYLVAEGDPSGGVWLAGPGRLTHFSESAVPDVNAVGALLPLDLSLDLHAGTLWLSTPERILEYSEAGAPLAPFGKQPGDSFAPTAGVVSIASHLIKGIRSFADRGAPLIGFVAPDDAAPINLKRPPLVLQVSDREGHVVVQSLVLSINGSDTALSCSPGIELAMHCNLSKDLPEGQVRLRVSIADDSGNVSSAERTLLIDTVAPAPPPSARIHVLVSALDVTTLKGDAGAVEAGAQVLISNTRTGTRVQVQASGDGSFAATLAAASGDSLQLTVGDAAGNISAPIGLRVPLAEARLEILEPLDGLVTSLRDLTVRGSLTFDGGVAVNGRPVTLTRSPTGWEFRTRIPLAPGQNVVDAVAHQMDGTEIHVTRSVSLKNEEPFGIRISTQTGVVPLTVRFSVNEYAPLQASAVTFDFEGSGITTDGDAGVTHSHTYATAGHYVAIITVRGENGSRYRYEIPVTAIAPDELDDRLQALWRQFIDRLGSPDPAAAAPFMESGLASRMQASFVDLGARLRDIASSFSRPVPTNASGTLAEYIVTREIGGSTRAFAIYFRLGADGIWRLASL